MDLAAGRARRVRSRDQRAVDRVRICCRPSISPRGPCPIRRTRRRRSPPNSASPTLDGAPVIADFDFRQTGPQTWDIRIDTDAGELLLSKGGGALAIDGVAQPLPAEAEYPSLYARFAALIAAGESDVDLRPFRHVADAFLRAGRREVEAFVE